MSTRQFPAVTSVAALAMLLCCGSRTCRSDDPGDYSRLLSARVMPDYEIDGAITFGEGQEWLPALQSGALSSAVFASYSEHAGNMVHLLVNLADRQQAEHCDPIVANDAVIVITGFPLGTEFPNAHGFVDLDGDPSTPENPIYWYGVVKRTPTGDDYRVIQVQPQVAEPFLLSFEVYGELR